MHTFQQYPADLLEINPFTKFSKEWALVSAGDKTKANTMTNFSRFHFFLRNIVMH